MRGVREREDFSQPYGWRIANWKEGKGRKEGKKGKEEKKKGKKRKKKKERKGRKKRKEEGNGAGGLVDPLVGPTSSHKKI